uniref:Uncharacterized protein n=1 Tax=Prymnesium polylepis TaxID=72548 RepID=A0A6T7W7U6_9EUKA
MMRLCVETRMPITIVADGADRDGADHEGADVLSRCRSRQRSSRGGLPGCVALRALRYCAAVAVRLGAASGRFRLVGVRLEVREAGGWAGDRGQDRDLVKLP